MQRFEHGGDVYSGAPVKLDFSINVNPMGIPPKAKQAIMENLDHFDIYPDTHCLQLRRALSEHHTLPMDHILCGNGASDLIFRICAWKRPRLALITAPTFSEYERGVTQFGGKIREYPLSEENGFLLTEAFLDAMTQETEMVFLCSPNNPTGRLIPEPLLKKILTRAVELDILLILDECFLPFTSAGSMAGCLNGNLLILRAFTKMYGMAGIRLGYLLGIPALLQEIEPYGCEWSVSSVAQVAGVAALQEENWVENTRQQVARERAWLTEQFRSLSLTVYPGEGNYILLRGAAGLHGRLKDRGILVRDCSNYSGLGEDYIRIGIKDHEKNEILVRTMQEVLHG